MDEAMRERLILILGVLTAMLFISTVSSCGSAYKNKLAQNKEAIKRMDLEEKFSKLSEVKAKQDEKLAALQKEVDEEKAGHQTTRKALVQEQLVNDSLKEELAKTTKLKEALEEDLKQALVQSKGVSKPVALKQ